MSHSLLSPIMLTLSLVRDSACCSRLSGTWAILLPAPLHCVSPTPRSCAEPILIYSLQAVTTCRTVDHFYTFGWSLVYSSLSVSIIVSILVSANPYLQPPSGYYVSDS
ncbi:hypothetical protein J6590_050161 [Homalodisca vitripennis]|nr:hypothetical protein J6590_050161 [Homalodisca vitripennis]